jgi:hypothetical protein
MREQGWHGDPFALHEDRWFSAGQPTRLVRDKGAESYDEPPDAQPELRVSPDQADSRQLARARLLSSRVVAAANHKPTRNWRYWTVWPPCLLTMALSVLAVIVGSISLANKPVATGPAASIGSGGSLTEWILLDLTGLIIAGVAAIVVLYAAADRQVSRRACALTGWVIAVLAYGWVFLIPFLSTL